MKILTLLIIIFLLPIYAKYTIKPSTRPKSAIDTLPRHNVLDMKRVPQNTKYYAKQVVPLTKKEQLRYKREYIKKFFSPWHIKAIKKSASTLYWQIRFVQKRDVYGFNKQIIPKRVTKWWIKNSNFKNLNTLKLKAISIKHTNLRAFPTTKDVYRNPYKSTEYYPFDYNQNSELHPNVPLFVSHYSLDKKWAFVDAGHTFGWVKRSDIAIVNSSFTKEFTSGSFAITIKDNLSIYKNSRYYTLVKLGSLFPKRGNYILLATKGKKGLAKIEKIKISSSKLIANFPIPFNSKNVSYISQQFYNEPYGWGGKAFCRDCSSTTRDFFAPFGIYLSRNSAQQAKEGKYVINIKGLPKAAKKRAIIKYAKPFRSLLYVPGHITLYIGKYKNEPIVMHTYWGIRLINWSKYTLSRTIITTTEPGKEHPRIREKSKLINTLQKIINF